jgi:hypothetical protein
MSGMSTTDPLVTTRLSVADGADHEAIRRLASLDASRPPHGPVILAEIDGEAVAALGIGDGHAVANPLRSSPAIAILLQLRRLEVRLIAAIWGF